MMRRVVGMKDFVLKMLEMVYDYIKDASGLKMFLSGVVVSSIVQMVSFIFGFDSNLRMIVYVGIMIISVIVFVSAYYFHKEKPDIIGVGKMCLNHDR